MVSLKSEYEIDAIRVAGKVVAECHRALANRSRLSVDGVIPHNSTRAYTEPVLRTNGSKIACTK